MHAERIWGMLLCSFAMLSLSSAHAGRVFCILAFSAAVAPPAGSDHCFAGGRHCANNQPKKRAIAVYDFLLGWRWSWWFLWSWLSNAHMYDGRCVWCGCSSVSLFRLRAMCPSFSGRLGYCWCGAGVCHHAEREVGILLKWE